MLRPGTDAEPSPESFQNKGLCVTAGELWVCAGGLDTLKIDKNSTDLLCFMFQFWGLGSLFGGAKAPKAPPVATGLDRCLSFPRGYDTVFKTES